jgi:hypothetical protein
MKIHAARKYVSPRSRPLTPEEHETRYISYELKAPREWDFNHVTNIAAEEMSALINGPCTLIPIPSSTGSTEANRRLANQIALRTPQARVVDCLRRTQPVESSCDRHKAKRGSLPVDQHHMERNPKKWIDPARIFFVDNTTTSGNTLRAAYQAIGRGEGLVFSDAGGTR